MKAWFKDQESGFIKPDVKFSCRELRTLPGVFLVLVGSGSGHDSLALKLLRSCLGCSHVFYVMLDHTKGVKKLEDCDTVDTSSLTHDI